MYYDQMLLLLFLTRVTVYKGVEIQLQEFLISALCERKWSNSRPGRIISRQGPPIVIEHEAGWVPDSLRKIR